MRDVDAEGFRNDSVPGSHDIVALGDSHTYGSGVRSSESWPQQLARRTGRTVYNMGVGSYGVYQYAALFELALERRPRLVIIGLYPANDLQGRGGCTIMALPAWSGTVRRERLDVAACRSDPPPPDAHPDARPTRRLYWWSTRRFALASLFDRTLGVALTEAPAHAVRRGGHTLSLEGQAIATHRHATSLDNPLNRSHFDNSRRLFTGMARLAAENGVGLAVLVIPSKERVLARWAAEGEGDVPEPVMAAVTSEELLTGRYRDVFDELGVEMLDATDALVELVTRDLAEGRSTYPPRDGHPGPAGYATYGEVAARLKALEADGGAVGGRMEDRR